MYRVLVIEDKPGEADRLRQMISEYGEDRDLEFQVVWARTAVELPEERRAFDLIFMDIGLPGINGMEAAEMLRTFDSETPLIFVTDLAQYAVKGYQVDALDFIIKPVQYYDFALRMDRAMRFVKRNDRGRLSIMTREGIRIFSLSDLVYVDVLDHNLNYHLAGGETLSLRGSLSKVG
ncbi:MAG TPA: LytTR family DNA-binding domain-containing protein, partial [Atopobiaceae bacterium]|nr:LytTR family DNA-binding domain-containing protein [Atopobiaceae bacterium]